MPQFLGERRQRAIYLHRRYAIAPQFRQRAQGKQLEECEYSMMRKQLLVFPAFQLTLGNARESSRFLPSVRLLGSWTGH